MNALLRLATRIDAANEWIGKIAGWFGLLAVVICTINAIFRYAFNMSSNAWLEIQWYFNAVMFLLVAAWALKRNDHVRIDVIGGKLPRKAATEFSFFLAVPTLVAAGAYDFWKNRALFDTGDVGLFAVGSITAFVSAFLCVRWLLRYIATHDFTPFAWYRVAFGAAVLGTAYAGLVNWSG